MSRIDRAFDPLRERYAFLRPKDWEPAEERNNSIPDTTEPRATHGPVDSGPREVDVRHGGTGRRVGITVLWALIAVLLMLGVKSLFVGVPEPTITVVPSVTGTWPDQQADAFAIRFATRYFTVKPGADESAVRPFLTRTLAQQIESTNGVQTIPFRVRTRQTVKSAVATGHARIDASHALISVAVTTDSRDGGEYLTYSIPVFRDSTTGGLAVYARPAPIPDAPQVSEGSGDIESSGVSDPGAVTVVQRFMRAWVAGDTTQMRYLSTPDARFSPMPPGFRVGDVALRQLCPAGESCERDTTTPTIQATVNLANIQTNAGLSADYFIKLARDRGGNWVIQSATTGT